MVVDNHVIASGRSWQAPKFPHSATSLGVSPPTFSIHIDTWQWAHGCELSKRTSQGHVEYMQSVIHQSTALSSSAPNSLRVLISLSAS